MIYATITVLVLLGGLFFYLGNKSTAGTLDEYITHRGRNGLLLTACSLAASVLGGWILFSPAETGTWAGISGVTGYAVGQAMPLFILAFAGPLLTRKLPKGYGLNDFVRSRYGAKPAVITGILMVFYMGTFLTAELTAIGQVFSLIFDIPLLLSCSLIMILVFSYVFRGGLGASIRTDKIQLYILIPLVLGLVITSGILLSDPVPVFRRIAAASPHLLQPGYRPGIEFGIVLFIGVTASNLFHQGFWQRVYAMKSDASQPGAFILGGLFVIPLVFAAGLMGIFASGTGILNDEPSLAIFNLLTIMPQTFTLILVILAFVLVLSSIDTLLNGIVSTIISWKGGEKGGRKELRKAQYLTIAIGIIAVILGSRGVSVLYLFLLADLLCSALAVPILLGLFQKDITGTKALAAGLIGLAAGIPFFPLPDFSSWSGLPANMLISFLTALGVSTLLALAGAAWDRTRLQKQTGRK